MPGILFRVHAVQRMFERKISADAVHAAVMNVDTIEDYSAEMPTPSRLLMGLQGKRPFHAVISENPQANEITLVTVYLPDGDRWQKDLRSRK